MYNAITKLYSNDAAGELDRRMYQLEEWTNYCDYHDHELGREDHAAFMHCLRWERFARNHTEQHLRFVSERRKHDEYWKKAAEQRAADPYADDIPF